MNNRSRTAIATAEPRDLMPMSGQLAASESHELSTAHAMAAARYEIESAMTVAQRFPRNEDDSYGNLMRSCKRPMFAEKAVYEFPRGKTKVRGATVNLARELARVWGNFRFGFEVVRDDGQMIHIRGWAWDMQTNTKSTQDASFRKLIYRKGKDGGPGSWVTPDERDLRELVNKHGAIASRNAVLHLMPADWIEDAMVACTATQESEVQEDPEGQRKKIVAAFADLGVGGSDIEDVLGKPIAQATPKDLVHLRQIYAAIRDGHAKWADYLPDSGQDNDDKKSDDKPPTAKAKPKADKTPSRTMDDLTRPAAKGDTGKHLGELASDLNRATTIDDVERIRQHYIDNSTSVEQEDEVHLLCNAKIQKLESSQQ